MSKQKSKLCLPLEVVGHDTKDRVDKPTQYIIMLKSKIPATKKTQEITATMKIIGDKPEIFDDFPNESTRTVTLTDEQTTLT